MNAQASALDRPATHTLVRGLMSVIDQGICSVGNFATVILLSRALARIEAARRLAVVSHPGIGEG